jgi:cysteine dioxygenase
MTIEAKLTESLGSVWTESGDLELAALTRFLNGNGLDVQGLLSVAKTDTSKPYGRRVLFQNDDLEVMIASWTRGVPCAPHDHGGSSGAVRVLQGRSRHLVWALADGVLKVVKEEVVAAGGVMVCGADMVHSMGDDGANEPLVTLHMYTKSVDHMVVYDLDALETLVVEGSCGAWVPRDQPDMVRFRVKGMCAAGEVR